MKEKRLNETIACLEDIRQGCFIDPDCGCWLWRGALKDGKARIWARDVNGVTHSYWGRRASYMYDSGALVPQNKVIYASKACANLDCVNPKHSICGTRNQLGKSRVLSGITKAFSTINKLRLNNRKKKLTHDQVLSIYFSKEHHKILAKKFNVSSSTIHAVKRGERYVYVPKHLPIFNLLPSTEE